MSSRKHMLKILFINFMKKGDDDDHEMSSTCFPCVSSRKRVLKILFISFMKKTDDDDHEMSSTCFPSVSSRKRVLKTSFTKKGWYLQARSQSGLKLTSHSWGTMHRSPGKRNNMWSLMGSQNAQHTGWVVADMTSHNTQHTGRVVADMSCKVTIFSTQDGWWLTT